LSIQELLNVDGFSAAKSLLSMSIASPKSTPLFYPKSDFAVTWLNQLKFPGGGLQEAKPDPTPGSYATRLSE
jgi:hypothetical protein